MPLPALPTLPLDIETGPGLKVSRKGGRTRIDLALSSLGGDYRAVIDRDYQALPTDAQIGYSRLTRARTLYLPDVDEFLFMTDFVVADEDGSCSEATPILIRPGLGTNDTIAGQPGLDLATPYLGTRFRRGAANLWIPA